MFKIGQGGQVVDATGEGVRLRPLADALSDVIGLGHRARASGSGFKLPQVERRQHSLVEADTEVDLASLLPCG